MNMLSYLADKNNIKALRRHRTSQIEDERLPSSLMECMDETANRETTNRVWRFSFIVLLVIPTLYYLHDLLAFETYRFLNRVQPTLKFDNSNYSKVLKHRPGIIKTLKYEEESRTEITSSLPICKMDRTRLGKFHVRKLQQNIFLENQYPAISKGGYYSPAGCRSRHKVGILVPYRHIHLLTFFEYNHITTQLSSLNVDLLSLCKRNREENLAMFLYNIHPFLMKQKLEYRIFVVEQKGSKKFNKGRLFNAGFNEMKQFGVWHCIVFHDVDLIPLDERILYTCPSWPRHMCATVIEKVDDPYYRSLFGGVTSMTPAQYEKVNGYSNLYWGWGGEDHDMFWRIRFAGFPITRYNKSIAQYTSLPHRMSPPNRLRYNLLRGNLGKYKQEGLSTLGYKLISITERHLYTHIMVDVNS